MHDFRYKKNQLFCEGVSVRDVAGQVGTPFYLYSRNTLVDHYAKLKKAFAPVNPLICFSVKANSNIAVLKTLVDEGAGLDIVSGGELHRAGLAGADPGKIVYAGVGKTAEEMDSALGAGILFFNAESLEEIKALNERARRLKKKPMVAVRINPDITAKTHKYITTGSSHNKFGVDFNMARWIFLNSGKFQNLRLRGVHVHIGSQIVGSRPFTKALKNTVDFILVLKGLGVKIEYLNIGGGLGIIYKEERPQTADEYARAILPMLKRSGLSIIMEPGRFICGNAGIMVTRVVFIKRTKVKNFIIVDAGMNDLVRPTLYEAYHRIQPVRRAKGGSARFDVVGPICESGDFFALNREFVVPGEGDLLAVMSTGAYGFSMSSNYNSRRRCSEVMVSGKKFSVIRKREDYPDLARGEVIPSFLK